MGSDRFDVVIIGAGPAGATAANFLAQKKYQVALVDRETFPRRVRCAGWLNAASASLLKELGPSLVPPASQTFRGATFYRPDFTETATPTFPSAPGYLIDRATFDQALVKAAVDRGVTFFPESRAVDFQLLESHIVAEIEGDRTLEGKLLILAAGCATALLEHVGIVPSVLGEPRWLAQVEAPLDPKQSPQRGRPSGSTTTAARSSPRKTREPRVGVVLGLDQGAGFAMMCVSPERMSVGINWVGQREALIPTLVHICRRAFECGAVPLDVSESARSVKVTRGAPTAALDMDSHVGKHTLVIGEAGGFVASASQEGIYPAMWSAKIAAEVADRAMHSVHSQDELMTFNSVWRMHERDGLPLAEYLRSPHTDIQFLLPLIFTNQPMADRMGAAFFRGENI